MLTPRKKYLLPEKNFPQRRIEPTTLHQAGQRARHTPTSYCGPRYPHYHHHLSQCISLTFYVSTSLVSQLSSQTKSVYLTYLLCINKFGQPAVQSDKVSVSHLPSMYQQVWSASCPVRQSQCISLTFYVSTSLVSQLSSQTKSVYLTYLLCINKFGQPSPPLPLPLSPITTTSATTITTRYHHLQHQHHPPAPSPLPHHHLLHHPHIFLHRQSL